MAHNMAGFGRLRTLLFSSVSGWNPPWADTLSLVLATALLKLR
jgi:hypothetical protein